MFLMATSFADCQKQPDFGFELTCKIQKEEFRKEYFKAFEKFAESSVFRSKLENRLILICKMCETICVVFFDL